VAVNADRNRRILFVVGGALVGAAVAFAAVLLVRDGTRSSTSPTSAVSTAPTTSAPTTSAPTTTDVTSTIPATSPLTEPPTTQPPTTQPRLLRAFEGQVLVGQACRAAVATADVCPPSQAGSWAFRIELVGIAGDGLSALGTIEWLELGSVHYIAVRTDGTTIHFEETEVAVEGDAQIGCVYDIEFGAASGWWSCPDGSNGPFQMA